MHLSINAKLFVLSISLSTSIFSGNLDINPKTIDFDQKATTLQNDKFSKKTYIKYNKSKMSQKSIGSLVIKNLSNQFNNSSYKAFQRRLAIRGLSGGIIGAGVGLFAGKFAVHITAQGAYVVVATGVDLFYPGSYNSVHAALFATCNQWVDYYSNRAAIGTAILLGTATGPV